MNTIAQVMDESGGFVRLNFTEKPIAIAIPTVLASLISSIVASLIIAAVSRWTSRAHVKPLPTRKAEFGSSEVACRVCRAIQLSVANNYGTDCAEINADGAEPALLAEGSYFSRTKRPKDDNAYKKWWEKEGGRRDSI